MTKIEVNKDLLLVEANGHADYSDKGSDIVCAAITTLVFALVDILQESDIFNSLEIDDLNAHFKVQAFPTMTQRHDTKIMFKTITNALKNLSDSYPNNIEYKEVTEDGR